MLNYSEIPDSWNPLINNMSITTTSNLPAPILQSLAPGMLSVPTPNFNYIIPAEKYSMPRQGGTTMRFLRPVPLVPPVVQLGNSGIEPASQIATREIIDSAMAFYGKQWQEAA